MQLEGLTGEQCAVLLDLAVTNKQFYHAAMLCTLPATQLVETVSVFLLACC